LGNGSGQAAAEKLSRAGLKTSQDLGEKRAKRGRRPQQAVGTPIDPRNNAADAILQAAIELISSSNYSTVSVKDIAAAANVNVSLIYYYYKSKENLFLFVLNSMLKTAIDAFDSLDADDIDPEKALLAWLDVHLTNFAAIQKHMKMCVDYSNSLERTPVVDGVISGYYRHEEQIIEKLLRRGIQKGVFRKVDTAQFVRLLSATIDGPLIRHVIIPTTDYRKDLRYSQKILLDYLKQR
jgi:AcrR family transcriptional regulator